MGRLDRERYEREKAAYKGPWKVPDVKDPSEPKKPMSPFLAFANERRKIVANENPLWTGSEISSFLSDLWRECPQEVKQAYQNRVAKEREQFKKEHAKWENSKEQPEQSEEESSSLSSAGNQFSAPHHATHQVETHTSVQVPDAASFMGRQKSAPRNLQPERITASNISNNLPSSIFNNVDSGSSFLQHGAGVDRVLDSFPNMGGMAPNYTGDNDIMIQNTLQQTNQVFNESTASIPTTQLNGLDRLLQIANASAGEAQSLHPDNNSFQAQCPKNFSKLQCFMGNPSNRALWSPTNMATSQFGSSSNQQGVYSDRNIAMPPLIDQEHSLGSNYLSMTGNNPYAADVMSGNHLSPQGNLMPVPVPSTTLPAVATRLAMAGAADRFEHYSIDDILQSEELFEDFSPTQVPGVSKSNNQNNNRGQGGGVSGLFTGSGHPWSAL